MEQVVPDTLASKLYLLEKYTEVSFSLEVFGYSPPNYATTVMSLQPRLVLLAAFIFTLNVFAFSERKFTAAPKHAGLRRRDTSFDPSYDDLTLVFAEGRRANLLSVPIH